MPGSANKLWITERQQEVLQYLRKSTTCALRLIQRATIVLLAFDGWDNQDIAHEVGLNRNAVSHWRRRWANAWESLILIECQETRAQLRRAIEDVLSDAPGRGSPGKFTPEQVTQILALACEPPDLSGRPITHWTAFELADEAQQRGIVPSISPSQVGRYLRDAALQPHKSRYWLNTKEKDPAQFQQKVEAVCDTYLQAPQLQKKENTHTLSTDEMTGVQALERIAAALPVRPGKVERREFEYKRHGTLTLIANFDVVTGELVAPTLGPTRTETDFVTHIAQTVATDPEARWVFLVDNLNIHGSESLVKYVAQTCDLDVELGKKRQTGGAAIAGEPAGIFRSAGPPHPVCVFAQAYVVAEPNRGGVWDDHAEGDPPRQLYVRGGFADEVGTVYRVF